MQSFKNKKVLIFGLGLNQGGVGSAKFFASQGAKIRVTDLKSEEILRPSLNQLKDFPNITSTLGGHKNEDIDWAQLVIKNPAVKPGNSYIDYAQKSGKRVEQDMGVFLDYVKPSQIIGITGTKGKSTTASLIYEVLANHLRGETKKTPSVHLGGVILAGNIGKSVLETIPHVKPDTLVILEISSFQLEAFAAHQVSPKWAVITNITPDHLNYYQTMEEYIQSKRIIGKYQKPSDFLFLRKNDSITTIPSFLKGFKAKITYYSKDDLPKNFKPHLMGEHNLENMAAAYAVGKTFSINSDTILKTLTNFQGIPFRMELIKTWEGVKIYNDTTATSPEAGIQAIKTASNIRSGNVVLICGGMNKGMDYTQFVTIVQKCVNKVFFLEGDSTDAILLSLRGAKRRGNLEIMGTYNDLEKLLIDIKKIAQPEDVVLFSPAATSFNLYQNEFDRGRKFNQAVEKIFHD